MEKIELFLPFPPTVNSYYSRTKYGVYVSKNGKAFAKAVNQCCSEQLPFNLDPLNVPLSVSVVLNPPDKRIRDLDNYMKALLDALTQSKVWMDDSLIDQLTIYRGEKLSKGRSVVIIEDGAPVLNEMLVALLRSGEIG